MHFYGGAVAVGHPTATVPGRSILHAACQHSVNKFVNGAVLPHDGMGIDWQRRGLHRDHLPINQRQEDAVGLFSRYHELFTDRFGEIVGAGFFAGDLKLRRRCSGAGDAQP